MFLSKVSGVTERIRCALKASSSLKRIDTLYKKQSLKQLIDIDGNEEAIKTFIHQL